jgi:hypothetical protein
MRSLHGHVCTTHTLTHTEVGRLGAHTSTNSLGLRHSFCMLSLRSASPVPQPPCMYTVLDVESGVNGRESSKRVATSDPAPASAPRAGAGCGEYCGAACASSWAPLGRTFSMYARARWSSVRLLRHSVGSCCHCARSAAGSRPRHFPGKSLGHSRESWA